MFYTLVITYILGGLTFIPLVVLGALAFAFCTADPVDSPSLVGSASNPKHVEEKLPDSTKTTSIPSTAALRAPSLKTWLTVRRTFEPSPASYISIVRTLLDARSSHPRRAEDTYYAVLKGAVLYLYEDEAMSECAAAIDIARCHVRVFPEDGLLDGELFAKRNALLIRENGGEGEDSTSISNGVDSHNQHVAPTTAPWFIFFRSVTVMEDWYFALIAAPRISSPSASAPSSTPNTFAPYPYAAHHALITSLDALPDLIPTRWLNALLGRLFLGVKGTRAVESWVIGRLMKKLAKVKTPGFLTAVVVRSFDAGDVAPVLSKPMLKELTPEGEASVGVDVSYIAPPGGEMRITISATATISLPGTASLSLLGFNGRSRDKEREHEDEKEKHKEEGKSMGRDKGEGKDTQRPYEVSLVLAIVVRRVEGNVLFKIKRPPSNRLWYAFTTAPHMEISVEPVVSDRRVRWGMVLAAIEGKLKEIIQESVVLPYMDDIPFFDTTPYELRGGIFGDAFSQPARASDAEAATTSTNGTATSATPDVASGTTSSNTMPSSLSTDRDIHAPQGAAHNTNTPIETSSMKQLHRTPSIDAASAREHAMGGVEGQIMLRAETMGATGGARKRRTWFGKREGSGDDDNGNHGRTQDKGGDDENLKVFVTQGREAQDESQRPTRAMSTSEGSHGTGASVPVGLSTSAPSASTVPSPSVLAPSPQGLPSPSPLHPSLIPRSPSPTSSASAPASSPPSTSSFLATLKTRSAGMAEKQPVLKEAIRKWGVGVNWAAGLRKDGGNGRDREKERERDRVRGERDRNREMDADMEADHGEFWGGTHGRSGAEGKLRGSYADLRRKVEGREQERLRNVSGESSSGGNETRPIDIPGAAHEKGTSSSRTPSVRSDRSSSSILKVSPQAVGGGGFLSPSAPRTTTELYTIVRTPSPTLVSAESLSSPPPQQRTGSTQSAAFPLPLRDEPTTPTQTTPIRAQPKAATMTIPGIHARHRGEVMALGSEPVKVEDAAGDVKGVAGEGEGGVGAGKTIQSVYRLLRRGNATAAGHQTGEDAGAADSRSVSSTAGEAPSASPSAGASPVPPPLPPRSVAQAVGSESADSPASQALKSVVQQDAARQPPPLPVRRASEQMLLKLVDPTAVSSSSPASLSASPSGSIMTTSSASNTGIASDQESSWLALTVEPESAVGLAASAASHAMAPNGNEKWKPPLPPRKSSSSVNNIYTA